MNSIEIRETLNRFLPRNVNFLGVYPFDKIPDPNQIRRQAPCCYVANTEPSGQLGCHWVAVYLPTPRTLEFFDTYGRAPTELGFHFPKSFHILHNSLQIQSNSSGVCGEHCIHFLYHRSHGKTMSRITSLRKHVPHSTSDFLVSKFISSFVKK